MPEKNKKILCIGAHFDDIEIGAGGFVARAKKSGSQVKLIIVGNGEYTTLSGESIRTKEVAQDEGINAGKHLGIEKEDIIYLNYPEGSIPYDKEIIGRIETLIKDFSPDLIITHWYHDTHQDHINVASAVVSAARYFDNLLMWEPIFPSGRHSPIPFVPQFYIDISDFTNQKRLALESHFSQVKKFEHNGISWVNGIMARAQYRGFECQSGYAEVFYVYRMKN